MLMKLFVLVCLVQGILGKELRWLNHLTKYIKNDLRVHQVILITTDSHNDNFLSDSDEDIIYEVISSKIPTWRINFQEHTKEAQIAVPLSDDLQTSLFIIIHLKEKDPNLSLLSTSINFVSNLSEIRSRPKCLLVLPQESKNTYLFLLRWMWSKQFLDVTLLDVTIVSSVKNKFFPNNRLEVASIQHFNPHSNKLKKEAFISKLNWFPDKVRNLQGYPIKIIYWNYPPQVFFKHDQSGRRIITGLGWLKMQVLSKAMNFQMNSVRYEKKGILNCTEKYKSTGLYRILVLGEFDISAGEFGRFPNCDDKFYEWGRGIENKIICVVVPVLSNASYSLSFRWKMLNLIVVSGLPLLIWFMARLFHFEHRNWRLHYMLQIVLATAVPREPRKLAERILFAYMLVMCLLNSSFIYSAFTDIGLKKTTTFRFEIVEDIVSSDIETVITPTFFNLLYTESDGVIRRLLKKTTKVDRFPSEMIQQLVRYKNLVLITGKEEAEFYLNDQKDKCDIPIARILNNEYLSRAVSSTVLAQRSPYVRRVDVIVQRMIESGITEKWKKMFFGEPQVPKAVDYSCTLQKEESMNVLRNTFFVLIFGYALSVITFSFELFSMWILKRRAANFKIANLLLRRN